MPPEITLYHGDAVEGLRGLPSSCIDAAIMDPPYPEINRPYGRLSEKEWWDLIVDGVIPEVRRVLKSSGSAVFILQPNSVRVGQMRGWLWEFIAWVCREWNLIQDVYCWNYAMLPCGGASHGLMRPSVKICVWAGPSNCYRNQDEILWTESDRNKHRRRLARAGMEPAGRQFSPSGANVDILKCVSAAEARGGVTPFNMLPITNSNSVSSSGSRGHGAGTPYNLADWWVRYICPPKGTVVDAFVGGGTMMQSAVNNGCNGIGIEKEADYIEIARRLTGGRVIKL